MLDLYRNGNLIASDITLPYTDENLVPNTEYVYELKDEAGNVSEPTTVTTLPEETITTTTTTEAVTEENA